jgi:hypothetical protein
MKKRQPIHCGLKILASSGVENSKTRTRLLLGAMSFLLAIIVPVFALGTMEINQATK